MSGLDLDALRDRWTAANRKLDDSLSLDVAAVRAALAGRTQAAFRRHSRWLVVALVLGAATLLALIVFMAAHRGEWRYVLAAAPLALLVLAEFVVDLRQWRALSQLDLNAPVLTVRAALDVLRTRRLKLAKWIMLTSLLLWWPAVMVLLKGLFGFDLFPWLHPSVLVVSLGIGLAFIPMAMLVSHLVARRFSGSPAFQRFLEDVAGRSWTRARNELEANARFDEAVETGGAVRALQSQAARVPLPEAVAKSLRALKRRLTLGIVVYASLMLLTGLFNAMHGGQPHFIVAGVLLHLVWVAHMVASSLHLSFVARLDFSAPVDQLRDRLGWLATMRAGLVRRSLAVGPLLVLPLALVTAEAGLGLDLLDAVSMPVLGVIVALAAAASVALLRRQRRNPGGFVPALVELGVLGAMARTRAVQAALK